MFMDEVLYEMQIGKDAVVAIDNNMVELVGPFQSIQLRHDVQDAWAKDAQWRVGLFLFQDAVDPEPIRNAQLGAEFLETRRPQKRDVHRKASYEKIDGGYIREGLVQIKHHVSHL